MESEKAELQNQRYTAYRKIDELEKAQVFYFNFYVGKLHNMFVFTVHYRIKQVIKGKQISKKRYKSLKLRLE